MQSSTTRTPYSASGFSKILAGLKVSAVHWKYASSINRPLLLVRVPPARRTDQAARALSLVSADTARNGGKPGRAYARGDLPVWSLPRAAPIPRPRVGPHRDLPQQGARPRSGPRAEAQLSVRLAHAAVGDDHQARV